MLFEKVIEARNLLQSGKVKRISEAVKAVGVSRGTYYKYKDAVFSFNQEESRRKAVITMVISEGPVLPGFKPGCLTERKYPCD